MAATPVVPARFYTPAERQRAIKLLEGMESEERAEMEELLAEADFYVEDNPLYGFIPHEKQIPFLSNRRKVKVFVGGHRAGKSTVGVIDDLIQAVDRDVLPDRLKPYKIYEPPFKCRIVTVDFSQSLSAVLEAMKRWCPRSQLREGSWEKAYETHERRLHFNNGSMIEFMTQRQDVDQFGGVSRHRVHFDEQLHGEKGERIREECEMRIMEDKGDELFTFTALEGLGWTFDEFEEEKGPEVEDRVWLDKRMVVVRASTDDNRHLDPVEVEERFARMDPRYRDARRHGLFVHFKGLVYPSFKRERHVVAKPDPKHVQGLAVHMEAIDPGVVTTAVLFAGFDKENRLLIYDELFLHDTPDTLPERVADAIRAKRREWGAPPPKYTLIDPSAHNRDLTRHDTVSKAYYRAGIPTVEARNDKEVGIFEVTRRLDHEDKENNPDPLLLIGENCPELIKELSRYRIKPTSDGSFDVVKRFDHGADCTKSLCLQSPTSSPPPRRPRPESREWIPGSAPPLDEANIKPSDPSGVMGKWS